MDNKIKIKSSDISVRAFTLAKRLGMTYLFELEDLCYQVILKNSTIKVKKCRPECKNIFQGYTRLSPKMAGEIIRDIENRRYGKE